MNWIFQSELQTVVWCARYFIASVSLGGLIHHVIAHTLHTHTCYYGGRGKARENMFYVFYGIGNSEACFFACCEAPSGL